MQEADEEDFDGDDADEEVITISFPPCKFFSSEIPMSGALFNIGFYLRFILFLSSKALINFHIYLTKRRSDHYVSDNVASMC